MAKRTTFIGLDTHKVATQVAMLLRGTEAPVDRERMNERSGTVIAVALTSQEPGAHFPLTLESKAPGLPIRSWIKISQIRTLATERIGRKIARASDEGLDQVLRVPDALPPLVELRQRIQGPRHLDADYRRNHR